MTGPGGRSKALAGYDTDIDMKSSEMADSSYRATGCGRGKKHAGIIAHGCPAAGAPRGEIAPRVVRAVKRAAPKILCRSSARDLGIRGSHPTYARLQQALGQHITEVAEVTFMSAPTLVR